MNKKSPGSITFILPAAHVCLKGFTTEFTEFAEKEPWTFSVNSVISVVSLYGFRAAGQSILLPGQQALIDHVLPHLGAFRTVKSAERLSHEIIRNTQKRNRALQPFQIT